MNVLLINSNYTQGGRSRYPVTPAPTGLITIASVLKRHGHKVQIHQLQTHILLQEEDRLPLLTRELTDIISEFPVDIIGISSRNIGAARKPANPFRLVEYYSVYYDARIVRALRLITNAPIVMGGTGFSIEPGLYMKYAQPDYGVIGEGEQAMLSLVESMGSNESTDDILGLVKNYSDVEAKKNQCNRVSDLSLIGTDGCYVVKDFRKHYYEPGGFAPIQTKRGCGLNCIYCTTPFLEGHRYRFKPVPHIIEEIKSYQEYWDAYYFFFVDATFNHPIEWAMEICNAILEAGLDIKWFSELTPIFLNDELCRLMVKSGCIAVTLTPDSCSEAVLKAYGKPFGMERVIKAMNLLKKHNILFDMDIIIGGPGETMTTFSETMDFCLTNLFHEHVSFYDGMIINTPTPAYKIAVEEGIIDRKISYEDIVLRNDFKEMKKYEYFFPHERNGRKEFLDHIMKITLGKRWRVTSIDFAPDPVTGEFVANSTIHVDPAVRPWGGWIRKDNN